MLLGCCHCGEVPPSDSTPPSESASNSSSSIGVVTKSCVNTPQRCIGDVAPAIFGINPSSKAGTQFTCFPLYLGLKALFVGANPVECFTYRSAEKPISIASGCPYYTLDFMWTLNITNGFVTCNAQYFTGGFLVNLVTYRVTITGQPINCVSSFTLTRTSTNPIGYPFADTLTASPI